MYEKGKKLIAAPRVYAGALLLWLLAACLLLPVAAAILCLTDMKAAAFHAAAFSISLLSSGAAAFLALRGQEETSVTKALFLGLMLTIILLTAGFLLSGRELKAGGILITAGATLIGSTLGGLLARKSGNNPGKKRFQFRRRV